MSLFGLTLAELAALFGAGAAALVVLYLLKLRRRRVEVPFAHLWMQVAGERESSALLRRLKRWLSLLLGLAFLALLVLALGDPRLGAHTLAGRTVVVLVDASASMQARDGSPTRMDAARAAAKQLIRGLGGADQMMLVRLDGQPAPVTGFSGDVPTLLRAAQGLAASDTEADLVRGLRLAADVLRGRPRPEVVLIGDGAYPEEALRAVAWASGGAPATRPASAPTLETTAPVDLTGITASFIPVGRSGDNVGIVAFSVRRYPRNRLSYEVFLEVQNFRERPATVTFELLAGGAVVDLRTLTIPAGARVRRIYPNLSSPGRRLEARLSRADGVTQPLDAFPLDDRAFALLPERRRLKVLLVSEGNLFLEGALLALAGTGAEQQLDYERISPADFAARPRRADVVIFDAFTPATPPPPGAYLYIDPREPGSPVPILREVTGPIITDLASHPITSWLTLTDTNIARASVFAPRPGDVVLAASFRRPVMVARRAGGSTVVAVGFDLRRSDLPMRAAFPVLLANVLDWFAGDDAELVASYRTGHTWRIPAAGAGEEVTVTPEGKPPERAPVHDGRAVYYGRAVGYYALDLPHGPALLAANLADPAESTIAPRPALALGERALARPAGFGVSLRRDLWIYLVLAALALTLVEWWTYNRRITI